MGLVKDCFPQQDQVHALATPWQSHQPTQAALKQLALEPTLAGSDEVGSGGAMRRISGSLISSAILAGRSHQSCWRHRNAPCTTSHDWRNWSPNRAARAYSLRSIWPRDQHWSATPIKFLARHPYFAAESAHLRPENCRSSGYRSRTAPGTALSASPEPPHPRIAIRYHLRTPARPFP